jgi:hypothetical protein
MAPLVRENSRRLQTRCYASSLCGLVAGDAGAILFVREEIFDGHFRVED